MRSFHAAAGNQVRLIVQHPRPAGKTTQPYIMRSIRASELPDCYFPEALKLALTKPQIDLDDKEAAEVKKVAKALLDKLKKEKLVLDWRKQQTTRAMVPTTIKDELDKLPRAYTKELYVREVRRGVSALL